MKTDGLLGAFLVWRARHLSRRNFVFILSIIIGVVAGLAAVVLKTVVHYIEYLLTSGFEFDLLNYLYFVLPLAGILLTVTFVKIFFSDPKGHGVTNILYAISRKSAFMGRENTFSHLISSIFTVGFGGSVGLEAPIVTTGSAIGSNIGRIFHLDYKRRTLLIGCGAAASAAAIFNAPITGVIFALEILLLELSVPSFIPILLSSITATIVSQLLLGKQILFTFNIQDPFHIRHIHWYIMLGVLAGLYSIYFTRIAIFVEGTISKLSGAYNRALFGGLLLGLLIFLFPPLFGEGYNFLKMLLNGNTDWMLQDSILFDQNGHPWLFVAFLLAILAFKVFATSFTIAAGGNGGIFAPSIFTGGIIGFGFARVINMSGPYNSVPETSFAMVGIAGIISGVMHAPLTAIFLVMEITSSYDLIIPAMIVSVIAYATIKYFEPHSIYASQLARKGYLLDHDKDKEVLTLLKLERVIETDLKTISPDATLGQLVKVVAKSNRNIYPVIDENEVLKGVVTLDDIRPVMFKSEKYTTVKVADLMHPPPDQVSFDEEMENVMKKFEASGAWNLPVIKDGKYVGFLSKSRIFSIYRRLLIHQSKAE